MNYNEYSIDGKVGESHTKRERKHYVLKYNMWLEMEQKHYVLQPQQERLLTMLETQLIRFINI